MALYFSQLLYWPVGPVPLVFSTIHWPKFSQLLHWPGASAPPVFLTFHWTGASGPLVFSTTLLANRASAPLVTSINQWSVFSQLFAGASALLVFSTTSLANGRSNQCWSKLFKLLDYSNSKDQIVVFCICSFF